MTPKQSTELESHAPTGAWGTEELDSADVLISRILCMQGLSKPVKRKDRAEGDLVDSVTKELLAPQGEPLAIVPLTTFKTIEHRKKNPLRIIKTDPYKVGVCVGAPPYLYTDQSNGEEVSMYPTINFYVVLGKELGVAGMVPKLLSFNSTNYTVGKILATFFAKCKEAKVPPASTTWNLSTISVERGGNSWFSFALAKLSDTDQKHMGVLYKWFKIVQAGVTVDTEKTVDATEEDVPF